MNIAFRPVRAVNHFVRWAEDEADLRMKEYFYPDTYFDFPINSDSIASVRKL